MSCCRPESIGPGPPGNRIQNNDLPYRPWNIFRLCSSSLFCSPPSSSVSLSSPSCLHFLSLCFLPLRLPLLCFVFIYMPIVFQSNSLDFIFFYTERLLRLMSPEGSWSSFSWKTACRDIRVQFRRRILDFGHGHQLLGKLHRPQTIWDDNPAGRERIWGGKHEHDAQKHLHHRINIRKVSVGQTTPSETYCLISGHSYDYQGVSNRA